MVEKIGTLPQRNYAVIIDEAHSSQGGEASKKMKDVLSGQSGEGFPKEGAPVKEPYPKYGEGDDDVYDSQELVNHYIERSAAARGPQSNLSFFAFTATPKYKTLAVFGYKDEAG